MGHVHSKIGAGQQPVSQAGRRKVRVTKREKERDRQEQNKKRPKTKKNPMTKKVILGFGVRVPRPHGLLKRPLGLSFDPQVPLDSGFQSQL
jgi:hypothetical protein